MEISSLRRILHQYVDKSDEKLLKLLYALAKEYTEDDDGEFQFSDDEISLLEERRAKRIAGERSSVSWDDAKAIVTHDKQP